MRAYVSMYAFVQLYVVHAESSEVASDETAHYDPGVWLNMSAHARVCHPCIYEEQ